MTRLSHFAALSHSVTDEYSRARALAELQNSSYPDIRKLDCTFAAGVLTVRGRLPSFYLKQVVWSLVGRLPEIDELADCIEVRVPVGGLLISCSENHRKDGSYEKGLGRET